MIPGEEYGLFVYNNGRLMVQLLSIGCNLAYKKHSGQCVIAASFFIQSTPLHLEPGPLYAVDGDTGINGAITYSILSGKVHGQQASSHSLAYQ